MESGEPEIEQGLKNLEFNSETTDILFQTSTAVETSEETTCETTEKNGSEETASTATTTTNAQSVITINNSKTKNFFTTQKKYSNFQPNLRPNFFYLFLIVLILTLF